MHCCRIYGAIAIWCILAVRADESGEYGEFEDEFRLDVPPDYTKIDVSDAAWNICISLDYQGRQVLMIGGHLKALFSSLLSDMVLKKALMRYLNFKENDMGRNLNSSICHRLSNRFAPKSVPPSGFCELQNGPGPHNFLVLGNSYAMNLGPIVYDTFKEHAKEFNIFSLKGCDTMVKYQRPTCKDNVNYTDLLQTLKPNVIFVLENHIVAKKGRNEMLPMDSDEIFREQLVRLKQLEEVAKKIYILQAVPSLNREKYYLTYTVTPIRKIKGRLIKNDDVFARQRIEELVRRCMKCEIIDIKPKLVDNKNRYRGYNASNNLLYIDQWNNFTRFGRDQIRQVFEELAAKFLIF